MRSNHTLKLTALASWLAACGGSMPLGPTPTGDGGPAAGEDTGLPSAAADVGTVPDASAGCRSDNQCNADSMCLGERCIGRCAASPPTNLVKNPGFDREVWAGVDKDRGSGPRAPRWEPSDSVNCPASGSLAVSDRTAFSPPMEIGPPGTRYFWGFRAKLTRLTPGPYCEVHWCTDITCSYFATGEAMGPGDGPGRRELSADWQTFYSGVAVEVPTPNPPTTPLPFAQIACFGYQEPNGPEAFFDRFYFSREAVPY
jgi:hypothetical protein